MAEDFYIPEEKLTFSMKALRFYFQRLSVLNPRITAKLFWYLFTKPRKRAFSEKDLRFYDQFTQENKTSREFKKEFVVLRSKVQSNGAKVLVLHGWEGRASDFSRLVSKLLAEGKQVLCVDFPGHGMASKSVAHLPIFVDVIESVFSEIKDVDLVLGHSLGAASLAMALPNLQYTPRKIGFLGLHPEPSQFFLQYKSVTKVNERVFEKCVEYAAQKTGKSLMDYSCYNHLDFFNQLNISLIHDERDAIIHFKRIEQLANALSSPIVFSGDHGGHFRHYKHPEVIEFVNSLV